MSPPIQSKAPDVLRSARRLVEAGLRRKPVWLEVSRRIPPPQHHLLPLSIQPSTSVTPSLPHDGPPSTGHRKITITGKFKKRKQEYGHTGKVKVDSRVGLRVPEIAFPEDRIRRRFYKEHPFELSRPRTLLEDPVVTREQETNDRSMVESPDATDYEALLDVPRTAVSAESAIRYAVYLHSRGRLEDEAYDIAKRKFHHIRRQQEAHALRDPSTGRSLDQNICPSDYAAQFQPVQYVSESTSSDPFELVNRGGQFTTGQAVVATGLPRNVRGWHAEERALARAMVKKERPVRRAGDGD